jgi:non-ribosomal peptide synthetase component F
VFIAKHVVHDFGLKQIKEDKKCISLGGNHHLALKQIMCSIFTQQKQTKISKYCPQRHFSKPVAMKA